MKKDRGVGWIPIGVIVLGFLIHFLLRQAAGDDIVTAWMCIVGILCIAMGGILHFSSDFRKWCRRNCPKILRLEFFELVGVASLFVVGSLLVLASLLYIEARTIAGQSPEDAMRGLFVPTANFSLLCAFLFGLFTIASFYVARKIEKSIRNRLYTFSEFAREAYSVFDSRSERYGLIVMYPHFGLLPEVCEAIKPDGDNNINSRIADEGVRTKLRLIVPCFAKRRAFLDRFVMGEVPRTNREHVNGHTDAVDRLAPHDGDSDLVPGTSGLSVSITDAAGPFHVAISDHKVVWATVDPDNPGVCTGFSSRDRDVTETFWEYFLRFRKGCGKAIVMWLYAHAIGCSTSDVGDH